MNKIIDVIFSIVLVYLAPVIASIGFICFNSSDFIGKFASLGMLLISVFMFGIACMGLIRISVYFKNKDKL